MFRSINKIIKVLIASDLALNAGWGFLAPVFAIFIVQNIKGGNVEVAGFSAMIYWITKSFLQIPIGKYLDKNHGEKDDFYFMVLGIFLAGLVPFGFLIASLPWHVYALQALHALGMALVIPSWSAIFTRHIDKGQEAFEWGLDSTSLGFGAGIAGAIGGLLVAKAGFQIVFVLVGSLTMLAAILLFFIKNSLSSKNKTVFLIPPIRPPME